MLREFSDPTMLASRQQSWLSHRRSAAEVFSMLVGRDYAASQQND
jgi:hypothetical protein